MFRITQKSILVEGDSKTVYGIKSDEISVDDISPDFDKVTNIITILNREQPSTIHIMEIVEDFLAMSEF